MARIRIPDLVEEHSLDVAAMGKVRGGATRPTHPNRLFRTQAVIMRRIRMVEHAITEEQLPTGNEPTFDV